LVVPDQVREVSRNAGSSGLVCNDRYLVCYSLADWQPVQLSSQLRGTDRTRLYDIKYEMKCKTDIDHRRRFKML